MIETLKIEAGRVYKVSAASDTAIIKNSSAQVWSVLGSGQDVLHAVVATGLSVTIGPFVNASLFRIEAVGTVTIVNESQDFSIPVTFASFGGGGGGGTWGSITGTLSNQTDLQAALNAKAPTISPTFTGTVVGITAAMVGAPSGSGSSSGTNTGDQINITGNAATVTTNANLTGEVTSSGNTTTVTNAAVIGKVIAGYMSGAGVVAATDTVLQAIQKLNGNASAPASKRVISLTDAATVTPNSATTDVGVLATLSQTTNFANPTGSPADYQEIVLRIKSTAIRTISFGVAYRGSLDLVLPTATSGSSLTDYFAFRYNSADAKWDYVAKNAGF